MMTRSPFVGLALAALLAACGGQDEAPEAEAEAAIAVIRRVMCGAAEPAAALSVPLVVDAKAAGNWDEAH